MNSYGLRDREYSLEKPEGVFRILILGDSMTFGHGINRLENTFPKLLERSLNENSPLTRFEVINASGPGWGSDTELYFLYESGMAFDPDMVIVSYFFNDIPVPSFFDCSGSELDLAKSSEKINAFLNKSLLYSFLKQRVNRFLEKYWGKAAYADCLKELYETRGWEMARIYLDSIWIACKIKGIKLMLAPIPALEKLAGDYPFMEPEKKLKGYCEGRQIEYIDIFNKGFKGKDESELWIDPSDRHINELGAEIVAKTIYNKLAPLKDYGHLRFLSKVFPEKPLLNKEKICVELEKNFSDLESGHEFVFAIEDAGKNKSSAPAEFRAYKGSDGFHFQNTEFPGQDKLFSHLVLDSKGRLLKNEKQALDPISGSIKEWSKVSFEEEGYIFSHGKGAVNGINLESNRRETKIKFVFKYTKLPNGANLELEDGKIFLDPKFMEKQFFQETYSDIPTSDELADLMLYMAYFGWSGYVNQLADAVIKHKPTPAYLRSVTRFYMALNDNKKVNAILIDKPAIVKKFITHGSESINSRENQDEPDIISLVSRM
ncbi:MAG: SGNH/GDSL hydrolase family protein [Nitrospinae bacterium]|nr:SGNH/GDSL hydrolase family protein [Nitrospinota bacterium]